MNTPAGVASFNPLPSLRAGLAVRYEVGEELGRGGMSIVYAARDLRHGREVAIKVIRPALLTDPETADRFLREIRYAATLRHPHILALYDSGTVGHGRPDPGVADAGSGPAARGAELLY